MKVSRSRRIRFHSKRRRSKPKRRSALRRLERDHRARIGGGHDDEIQYLEKYSDEKYEYRHVRLPPSIAKLIPKGQTLNEVEWSELGVQSSGWKNYDMPRPDYNVFLFRRPLEEKKRSIVRAVAMETADPHTAPIEAFAEEPLVESIQGITEFDAEIIAFLKEKELKYPIKIDYEKHKDITLNMRAIAIDWIVEVCEEYHIDIKTRHLCVSLFDRYSCLPVKMLRSRLQLIIMAALLIAMKSEEIFPATVDDVVYISDNTFSRKQLIEMETTMLEALNYEISFPTCIDFATYYHTVLKLSRKQISLSNYVMDYSM